MTLTLQDMPPPIPSPRIPPECIGLVALYLWDDVRTLHALLLCNRMFFSLAAPLLYRSPFQLIDSHRTWNESSKAERTARLVRLLYLCTLTKQNQVQDLSSSSHAASSLSSSSQQSNAAAITTGVNKMSFQQEDPALQIVPFFDTISLPLATDYLFHYTHQGQIPKTYRAFERLFKSCSKKSTQAVNMAVINRKLSFAFISHFPSRIQVLSVTPSQLGSLLRPETDNLDAGMGRGIVDDLRMLRRLELAFGGKSTPLQATPSYSLARDMRLGWSKKPLLEEEDIPLEFLRQHRTLFVSEEDASLPPITSEDGPLKLAARRKHEQQRIEREEDLIPLKEIMIRGSHATWTPMRILSQIHPLEVVDLSAWNSDVPDLDQIPTRCLKSLRTNISRRLDLVEVETSILQKAHRLEDVWMPCQRPDSLTWAIDLERPIGEFSGEARNRRRGAGRAAIPTTPTTTSTGTATQADAGTATAPSSEVEATPVSPVIVPSLRKIRLYGEGQDLVQSLEDAADSFRDSIEELTGFEDGSELRDTYIRLTIDWLCPRLTVLELCGRFVRYMDLQSLRQFPELRVVRLTIEVSMPRSSSGRYSAGDSPDASDIHHRPLLSAATSPSLASQDSAAMGDDEDESPTEMAPTALEAARRRYSIFTNMKRLEELQLRGPHWDIDDNVLQVLTEPVVPVTTTPGQNLEEQEATSNLRKSLRLFYIPQAHLCSRAKLTQFAQEMQRLEVLQLGTVYGWLVTKVENAVGPRLSVDINM